jgi:hypothetical protein
VTTEKPLPEWPDAEWNKMMGRRLTYDYQAQLADAAMARLRVACEALEYCRMNMSKALAGQPTDSAKEAAGVMHARAFNALSLIGELPPA